MSVQSLEGLEGDSKRVNAQQKSRKAEVAMVIFHMYSNQHTLHSLVESNGGMHETKHAKVIFPNTLISRNSQDFVANFFFV